MKSQVMKAAVLMAQTASGPISRLAVECMRGNSISIDRLEPALKADQYSIQYTSKTNGAWAHVYNHNQQLVAQGYSFDGRADALLHAIFGAVREEATAANHIQQPVIAPPPIKLLTRLRRYFHLG